MATMASESFPAGEGLHVEHTITEEVKVVPNKGKLSRRLRDWVTNTANSLRRAARRTGAAIKNGGIAAADLARRAGNATWRGARKIGSTIYWSGAAFGRALGRTARFLGRSALTLVVGTARFLGRTLSKSLAWTTRGVSWVFSTVLDTVFMVSLAAFLITALLMLIFSFLGDKYDETIHSKARSWSVGHSHPMPEDAHRDDARRAAGRVQDAFGTGSTRTTTVVEDKPEGEMTPYELAIHTNRPVYYVTDDGHHVFITPEGEIVEGAPTPAESEAQRREMVNRNWITDQWENEEVGYWHQRTLDMSRVELADFPFHPNDIVVELALDCINLSLTQREGQEWRTSNDRELTENQQFQVNSYWAGRQKAWQAAPAGIDLYQISWDEVVKDVSSHFNKRKSLLLKDMKKEFDNRAYHRQSFIKGWDHMVQFYVEGFIKPRYDKLYPEGYDPKAGAIQYGRRPGIDIPAEDADASAST